MQGIGANTLLQEFIFKCQEHNLKVTPQRMAIYRELIDSTAHPTVDAMFQIVKNEFPNISYDTVSRTMLTFAEIGIVDLVEVYGGAKRFDPNVKSHHHLHCVSCGNILDFQNDQFNNLDIPVEIRQRFTVLNSRVILKGICDKCSNPEFPLGVYCSIIQQPLTERRKNMSKTTDNLKAAFAGESQARNKYTFFAEVAREEGYHYIAKILEETAYNEMQHAKDHLKLLNGIGDTAANLKEAFGGEDYEVESMYPGFAAEAAEEGEKAAEIAFKQVAKIEAHHRARYKKLLEMVEAGTVYKREQPIKWKCGVCGYIFEGNEPPPKCPSCKNPKEYYEPASLDF